MYVFDLTEIADASKDNARMVFDWDKAAEIIKRKKSKKAAAGLRNDWYWTGGVIYKNGEPVMDDYTYLASTWAVPELFTGDEIIECYKMENEVPDWDENTKWPESALQILKENDDEEDI